MNSFNLACISTRGSVRDSVGAGSTLSVYTDSASILVVNYVRQKGGQGAGRKSRAPLKTRRERVEIRARKVLA